MMLDNHIVYPLTPPGTRAMPKFRFDWLRARIREHGAAFVKVNLCSPHEWDIMVEWNKRQQGVDKLTSRLLDAMLIDEWDDMVSAFEVWRDSK